MKLYQCETHGDGDNLEDFPDENCEGCKKVRARILEQQGFHERKKADGPIVKLLESVYWPTDNGHDGRLIHNLEHKPVFFASKREYRNYLREKGIRERG